MTRSEPIAPQALPTPELLRAWLAAAPADAPRATICLPLAWAGPEAKQNAVHLENAARDVEAKFGHTGTKPGAFGARLRALELAAHGRPGPAAVTVLLDTGAARAVALHRSVPYRVQVASRFALRPLLAAMRRSSRYRVLAVSAGRVALFEGGPEGLAPAPVQGLPTSLEDALGSEKTENELRMRGTRAGGGAPIFYSHSAARDEQKLDLARFHEALGRVLAGQLGDGAFPMVLVATDEHQVALRAAAKIPALLAEGVVRNPDHLSPMELHAAAWPRVEHWLADRDGGSWERARNRGKGLELLDDVAAAAVAGRVRRLWVDAARSLPGGVDIASARIVAPALPDDDVLDALAEIVVGRGGEVLPVEAPALPSSTGAAAELH